MVRLGLRLTLRSGREALVRLLITAAAVAVGVALLLGVLAEFHAFQANASQACWSCTKGAPVPSSLPSHGELWNNSVDFYQGQTITRLDVAPLGAGAPVPPGITRLPRPVEYYASPALAALLADRARRRARRPVPRPPDRNDRRRGAERSQRPGDLHRVHARRAQRGPGPPRVQQGGPVPGTQWVTSISTAPAAEVFTPFFRYAFGVGVLAVLFPMLVLISTATRLAADRREERFAALRLVGGTPADIRVIASVESVVSAFCGAVLGIVVFLLVRPALAGAALTGTPYFESQLTPTVWGYLAMLVGVPVAAAVAALISLRRVQISPLGVSRRAKPKPPTFWRLATLVLGLGLYVYGLSKTTHQSIGAPAYPGLLLTMIGLVIAGPYLTSVTSRLFGRLTPGSSALLATRRLADNPKTAFRSVTGLVLAVFLGTMVGTLVPAVNATEASPANAALRNVLLDQVGLDSQQGAKLLSGLSAIPGATVYPLYSLPTADGSVGPGFGPGDTAVSCAVMRSLAVLGQCAPGLQAVQASDSGLFDDNPMYNTKPFIDSTNPAYTGKLSSLPLQTVMVRVNSPATLERVRTYLTVNTRRRSPAARARRRRRRGRSARRSRYGWTARPRSRRSCTPPSRLPWSSPGAASRSRSAAGWSTESARSPCCG